MFYPGPHLIQILTLAAIVAIMLTVATNKTEIDSITATSSPSRSAAPHMLGPPTSTCTSSATRNCTSADDIMLGYAMITATNMVIPTVPTVPRALHDPSAVRGANDLLSTTFHEGHHHVHDRGGADEIMIDDDTMLTVANNTIISTLPPVPHDPSAVRDANDLGSTTSHEGHHRVHDHGADVHDFGFFDVIMPGADYNNDYLLETCHSSAPPPRASVPRIERDSTSPDARDRPIVAAITDDATAIAIGDDATIAAIVVKPRNDNAHRASLPLSTGPILSVPERRMRVTA